LNAYTRRHGINRFDQPLSEEHFAITYPVLLREAGYRTGFIGKWGLGGRLPKEVFDLKIDVKSESEDEGRLEPRFIPAVEIGEF